MEAASCPMLEDSNLHRNWCKNLNSQ